MLDQHQRDLRRVGDREEELDVGQDARRKLLGRELLRNTQDAAQDERRATLLRNLGEAPERGHPFLWGKNKGAQC